MRDGMKRTAMGILLSTCFVLGWGQTSVVLADDEPRRSQTIEVSYTEYDWWLVYWQDNTLACDVRIDHEGEPTLEDVYNQCGEKIFNVWASSESCPQAEKEGRVTCQGLYAFSVGREERTRRLEVELPIPRIWSELHKCISVRGTELCSVIPSLMIIADEPLPNESILKVQGTFDQVPFLCFDNSCELPLYETGAEGVPIEFWAVSSYGDSTLHYRGRIRVAESDQVIPFTTGWKIDIVSENSDFNTVVGCARIWESFPSLGTPPEWLENPRYTNLLESDQPYTYLAGQLIQKGYVDTSDCAYYGLMANGYASQCGLEKARSAVKAWQNTYDKYIIESAQQSGIPSQLLKRIFAKESQFWPATTKYTYHEYGPGHINELGADTALFWNRDFYNQFCPLILKEETCKVGYARLDDWDQVLLRGAFLSAMEIDLPYRGESLDPAQARASVSLFSETLLGNCSQVEQIMSLTLGKPPGEVISYEDLWKFTLVNYHAGSGCLSKAVKELAADHKEISWENLVLSLEGICPEAIDYVNDIVY
jgi:hypothetical protein